MACCFLPNDLPPFKAHFAFNRQQFTFGGTAKPTHLIIDRPDSIYGVLVDDYDMPKENRIRLQPVTDWHPARDRIAEFGYTGAMVEVLFDSRVCLGWICEEK